MDFGTVVFCAAGFGGAGSTLGLSGTIGGGDSCRAWTGAALRGKNKHAATATTTTAMAAMNPMNFTPFEVLAGPGTLTSADIRDDCEGAGGCGGSGGGCG